MDKEEVLEKAKSKKSYVGEMESKKTGAANWVALIVAGVLAVAFIITEGCLRHFTAQFAISAICFTWASVFYTCQFFMAKRPWPVLIGSVLEGLAATAMIVLFAISYIQAW